MGGPIGWAAMATNTETKREQELGEKELLAGVPPLKPASAFRQREKSNLTGIAIALEPYLGEDGEVDQDQPGAKKAMLDFLADADEFFESIAIDKDVYVEWATGLKNSEQVFGALLAKYQRELGE